MCLLGNAVLLASFSEAEAMQVLDSVQRGARHILREAVSLLQSLLVVLEMTSHLEPCALTVLAQLQPLAVLGAPLRHAQATGAHAHGPRGLRLLLVGDRLPELYGAGQGPREGRQQRGAAGAAESPGAKELRAALQTDAQGEKGRSFRVT